jgi:hypothetical protein
MQGNLGIKINDDVCHYLHTTKELRHGDLMSPILFNFVADMFAILTSMEKGRMVYLEESPITG